MTQNNGPWTIQETTRKYRNSFIEVQEDRVIRPDGESGIYATVAIKPGVAILPIDGDRIVYLTRQFRYALGKESIEVVCGAMEEDEPPLEAARREVKEELGIEADEWHDLGFFQIDTSIVRCPVYLFLATQLHFSQSDRDPTETITPLKIPLDEAVKRVMDSEILHGSSCVLILKALQTLRNLDFPRF